MGKANFVSSFMRKLWKPQHKYTYVDTQESCNSSTIFIPLRYVIVFVIVLSCAVDYITRVSNETYCTQSVSSPIQTIHRLGKHKCGYRFNG